MPFAPSFDTVGLFARTPAHLRGGRRRASAGAACGKASRAAAAADRCLRARRSRRPSAPLRRAAATLGRRARRSRSMPAARPTISKPMRPCRASTSCARWAPSSSRAPRFGATIAPRFAGVRALDPAVEPQWRAWRTRDGGADASAAAARHAAAAADDSRHRAVALPARCAMPSASIRPPSRSVRWQASPGFPSSPCRSPRSMAVRSVFP